MKLTISFTHLEVISYQNKQSPPHPPHTHKKKKKKKRKKPVIHLGCHLHALFSVECHGFEFLKFHSVTDDDIMTTGSFKGK